MPLGECMKCDTCDTPFWQDPVDLNKTCQDCIDRLPIPRCKLCDGLIYRDNKSGVCRTCNIVAILNCVEDE